MTTDTRKPITPKIARKFFEALEENEENMGEIAALAVTLEQFGYDSDEFDVLADMSNALPEDNQ